MQLVDLTSASSQLVPMSIDLARCLADPKVSRNAEVCPYVYVEAFLLTGQNTIDPNNPTGFLAVNGNNLLDVDFVGPFAVSLNATATTPRALVLHEVQSIDVSPTRLSLQIGQTSSLTATVLDLYGKPVAGRTVTWSSGNNVIATVSASGLVTALRPGNTSIIASAGGRSTVVPVSVQLPRLVVEPEQCRRISRDDWLDSEHHSEIGGDHRVEQRRRGRTDHAGQSDDDLWHSRRELVERFAQHEHDSRDAEYRAGQPRQTCPSARTSRPSPFARRTPRSPSATLASR